jgi:hypothetical protein
MKTFKPGLTFVVVGLILQIVAVLIGPGTFGVADGGGDTAKMIFGTILGSLAMVAFAVGVGQMLIAYWHSSNRAG